MVAQGALWHGGWYASGELDLHKRQWVQKGRIEGLLEMRQLYVSHSALG
jgi:hypothetical protein